ncbi:protein phosphatase 2C domain-containing protein [Bernardetia sp. ABR2-2B]|uniref:PP2C family protein-serine/threonine phosphatase n=1 Tax=Bernardetia sp. ABR2-2B TaxID=3127472 RepID=UPI0030CB0DA5
MMTNNFEIVGKSIKDKEKTKNGDSFNHIILENNMVILTLADGVGSKNCDWVASKEACDSFINYSQDLLGKDYTETTLLGICNKIDKGISNAPDTCKGMLTVFAAVIWDIDKNHIHFINIGDTRIYKINRENIEQISIDETKDVIIRNKQGKVITSGGTTIVRNGVTNALGTGNVEVTIKTTDFNYGESIVLASDGFYDCKSTFNSDIKEINKSSSLQKSINRLFKYYADYQKDDTTLLILRRNDIEPKIRNEYRDISDFEKIKSKLATHTAVTLLTDDLKLTISKKNKENCILILDKMKTENLIPSREKLDELLSFCQEISFEEREVYKRIIDFIRIVMRKI